MAGLLAEGSAGGSLPCAVKSAVQRPISVSPSRSAPAASWPCGHAQHLAGQTKGAQAGRRQRSKVRRRTAKPLLVASRSTSRVINAVVALPCSMSGDRSAGMLGGAKQGPSGLKMAVMGVSAGQSVGRLLRQPENPTIAAEVMLGEACGRRPLSGVRIGLSSGLRDSLGAAP
jgi:hypothetical protein